jgi:hypothetical protein
MSGLLLEMACKRMPNPLPPTPEESKLFSLGVGQCVEKYLPMIGEWAPEATLLIAVTVVFLPRMVKPGAKKIAPLPVQTGSSDTAYSG